MNKLNDDAEYGVLPVRDSSDWDAAQITEYLTTTVQPLRLSLEAGGAPIIVPLWYRFENNALWCASQRNARLVKWIERQPMCGFDISANDMPYKGIRGQGKAHLEPGEGATTLRALVQRYLGSDESDFARWLLARSDDEVAIRIQPAWLTAWDFTPRMAPTGRSVGPDEGD